MTSRSFQAGDPGAALRRHLLPAADALAGQLGHGDGRTAVDIGTGDGPLLRRLLSAGWHAVGVDLTVSPLQLARASGLQTLAAGDACALPLATDSVDAVASNFGLIFAGPLPAALAEAHRVCRRGGTLMLTAWTAGGWPEALREILAAALNMEHRPFPTELGALETAEPLLQSAGWSMRSCNSARLTWRFGGVSEGVDVLTTTASGLRGLRAEAERRGLWSDLLPALRSDLMGRSERHADGIVIHDSYVVLNAEPP